MKLLIQLLRNMLTLLRFIFNVLRIILSLLCAFQSASLIWALVDPGKYQTYAINENMRGIFFAAFLAYMTWWIWPNNKWRDKPTIGDDPPIQLEVTVAPKIHTQSDLNKKFDNSWLILFGLLGILPIALMLPIIVTTLGELTYDADALWTALPASLVTAAFAIFLLFLKFRSKK